MTSSGGRSYTKGRDCRLCLAAACCPGRAETDPDGCASDAGASRATAAAAAAAAADDENGAFTPALAGVLL